MTKEEVKSYIKENIHIDGSFHDSECFGKIITLSIYLDNEEISKCEINLY